MHLLNPSPQHIVAEPPDDDTTVDLDGGPHPYFLMIFTDDHVAVGMPMSGSCVLAQDGREAVLRPGDFAVVDTSRPYQLAFSGIERMLVTTARRAFRLRPDDLGRVTARRVPCRTGRGPRPWAPTDERDPVVSDEPAEPVLDLIAAGLAELTGRLFTTPAGDHRTDLLAQIHQHIERNLGDPRLSPHTVAAAHHISVRYLHKLFQSNGETVNGWIRERRLDRCKRDLTDPRYRNRSIGAIGARWNLAPASYFSRVFRARYGSTPSEVRATAALPHVAGVA